MLAFVILIIVILSSWLILNRLKNKRINIKLVYCVICGIALLIVAGTRNPSLNFGDDSMYIRNFNYVQDKDFTEIYEFYKTQDTEVVFYELVKIVSIVTANYNVLLVVCAAPVIFAVSKMIYKRSKSPPLAFLLFTCAFFFLWSLVLLRQAIAMAFVIFAIESLIDKKYWKYLLLVIIAALFHRTAMVFLLALPISFVRYSRKSLIVFAALCILGFAFGEPIINYATGLFSGSGHFAAYLTREESYGNWQQIYKFIIFSLLTLATIFVAKKSFKKNNGLSLHLCMVGCLFCLLAPFFAETYRLALYFLLPIVLVLPNAFKELKDNKKVTLLLTAIIVSLVALGFVTFHSMGYQNILLG